MIEQVRLSAEHALRAAIDTQIFSALRELSPLDGGRAVQAVFVSLIRRLPNVIPDRRRISIDSGFSESSVKRAIKLLEECGLLGANGPHVEVCNVRACGVSEPALHVSNRCAWARAEFGGAKVP